MVNSTDLNDSHYWGMVNTGNDKKKRKRRDAGGLGISYDGAKMTITVDNSHIANADDLLVDYEAGVADPTCVGLSFENDDQAEEGQSLYYLQWKEFTCSRAQNTVCEVDLKRNEQCIFGKPGSDQLITTDPWSAQPDECVNYKWCDAGVVRSGTCPEDQRFDIELRQCVSALDVDYCDIDECACTGQAMIRFKIYNSLHSLKIHLSHSLK